MPCELFVPWKPHAASLTVVEQANTIIDEYIGLGFNLTLRQLFYQFVAPGLLKNLFNEYKRLGTIVRNARDAGLIDWAAIEDRTREVNNHAFWDSPSHIISDDAEAYREDLWAEQHYRPELWIEKDALIGVIESVCTELRVPYFAQRQQFPDAAIPSRETLCRIFGPRSNSAGPASCRPRSEWYRHDPRQYRAA